MNNYLKETLIFQQIFGVKESFDFITGRDFFAPIQENTTPSLNNTISTPQNTYTAEEQLSLNKPISPDGEFTAEPSTTADTGTLDVDLSQVYTFDELVAKIKLFNGCNLKRYATNDVIFDGNKNAKIMLIGEAPGENEDLEGKPFCGQSGKLLRKALSCINLTIENMLITNTVYWRPPDNRKPYAEEINMCLPFLKKMISLVKPKIVILCGATAIETILKTKQKMSEITGKLRSVDIEMDTQKFTLNCFPIYHPSYLLRVPSMKKTFWEHLLILQKEIDKNIF